MVRTCRNKTAAPIMRKAAGIKEKTQNVRFTIHIYIRSHVAAIFSRFEPGMDVRLLHCSTPETRDSNTINFIKNTLGERRLYSYIFRSEERRVGKEWVRKCRSRWARYH